MAPSASIARLLFTLPWFIVVFLFFSFYTFQVEQKVELLTVDGSLAGDLLVVSHDIPSREIIVRDFEITI
jgi:hypothetical protein